MALNSLKVRLTVRGDTKENWAAANPVLLQNEAGRETDTNRVKYGDGVTAWIDLPYFAEQDAVDIPYDNAEYPTIAEALDALLYKKVEVDSFVNNVNTAEIGSTVNEVTLSWELKGNPTSVKVDTEEVGADVKSKALTELGLTSNKTWTLSATDGTTSAQATTSVVFLNGLYYGTGSIDAEGADDVFVQGLTKTLTNERKAEFTVDAVTGKFIYFALPARLGTPVFTVGGFIGGFELIKTFDFTNASGYKESYKLYRSENEGLGQTSVAVS